MRAIDFITKTAPVTRFMLGTYSDNDEATIGENVVEIDLVLVGYVPQVGDRILLLIQGELVIAIGKVS